MKITKKQIKQIIKEELSSIMEDDRGLQAGEERNNAVTALGSVTSNQQIIDIISSLSDDALWGQQTMRDAESGEDPTGWGDPWGSILALAGLNPDVSAAVADAVGLERQARLDTAHAVSQTPPPGTALDPVVSPDAGEGELSTAARPSQAKDMSQKSDDTSKKPEGEIPTFDTPEESGLDAAEDTGDLARGDYTLQDYEREYGVMRESFRRFLK